MFKSLRFGPVVFAIFLVCFQSHFANAAVLEVGPDRLYKTPSAASVDARDGDVIEIAPGTYYDCAIFHANHLAILGSGPGVVITDTTCQNRAIFIVAGNDTTIRNITLTRARSLDRNGSGIRVDGKGLLVQDSRFVDNESGVFALDSPGSRVSLVNDDFIDNGRCDKTCIAAVRVGRIAVLHIENSRISGTKAADQIMSDAVRTELINNDIKDGPDGSSAFLVELPSGGSLVMTGNRLEKGLHSSNPTTAIMLGGATLAQESTDIRLTKNVFVNDTGGASAFVRNWLGVEIVAEDNSSQGTVIQVTSGGGLWHRAKLIGASFVETLVKAKNDIAIKATTLFRSWR